MKNKQLINSGIHILNNIPDSDEKTLIVLGAPRSGTSMIGKVLYSLGKFKGNSLDLSVFEDNEAIKALEGGSLKSAEDYFLSQNKLYKTWGFKRPGAFLYIRNYETLIRNAVYIIPFKDMLSISLRKNISIGQEFNESIKETLEHYTKLVDFILTSNNSMLLFSYEKAILDPKAFVHSVIDSLKLQCTKDQISHAINCIELNPKNYLNSSREIVRGSVDQINKNIISGWAKASNHNKAVDIMIYLNNNLLKTLKANIFREDLLTAKIGNGHHAFRGELNLDEIYKKGDKISVFAGIHQDELKNSPLTY